MRYVVTSTKSVDQAAADLEVAVRQRGGVLHQYDLKKTLAGKGVDLPHECRILDVCNPRQAARVLAADMGMNVALPCRIAVYEDGGQTRIAGHVAETVDYGFRPTWAPALSIGRATGAGARHCPGAFKPLVERCARILH